MDAARDLGSAAKGSAIDLEVAGSGLVNSLLFLTMCRSLACLLLVRCHVTPPHKGEGSVIIAYIDLLLLNAIIAAGMRFV